MSGGGKVIDAERNVYDDAETFGVCVECQHHIDVEHLPMEE